MNKKTTKAIILKRINFSESDRIMTLLTPDQGKLRAIAKGVRKEKSKLAGGLELLSISQIGYLKGKGDLDQIVSTKLIKHFENIVTDYDRVDLAYKAIEMIDKITEDEAGEDYFNYLVLVFEQLDDLANDITVVELWLRLQILAIHGHLPNLSHDCSGKPLEEAKQYIFSGEDGCFKETKTGNFSSDHIKVWRILVGNTPSQSRRVTGVRELSGEGLDQLITLNRNLFHAG